MPQAKPPRSLPSRIASSPPRHFGSERGYAGGWGARDRSSPNTNPPPSDQMCDRNYNHLHGPLAKERRRTEQSVPEIHDIPRPSLHSFRNGSHSIDGQPPEIFDNHLQHGRREHYWQTKSPDAPPVPEAPKRSKRPLSAEDVPRWVGESFDAPGRGPTRSSKNERRGLDYNRQPRSPHCVNGARGNRGLYISPKCPRVGYEYGQKVQVRPRGRGHGEVSCIVM